MCKVKQYRYACAHYLKMRSSRCGGTKSKETKSRTKAACCAEAYITINLPFNCSKCQQEAWITTWRQKLYRASTFRDRLVEKGLPGAEKVADMVKALEDEYTKEAWDLRTIFPQAAKASIERVRPAIEKDNAEKRLTSLLQLEVLPCEVVLPIEKKHEEHQEEHVDDYERSTDPFHPIDTNYELPVAGIDDSVLEQFTQADSHDTDNNDCGFEHSFNGWDWGGDTREETNNTSGAEVDEWVNTDDYDMTGASELTAWGPDAETKSSAAEVNFGGIRPYEEIQNAKVEEIIKAFWEAVNIDTDYQQAQHPESPSKKTPNPLIRDLTVFDLKLNDSNSNDSEIESISLCRFSLRPRAHLD